MYVATQFSSVEDKLKFEKQFKKFVSNGYKESQFPKWFYTRLSMTFGHIAHYNQQGFYQHFFTTNEGIEDFKDGCLNYPCYGDPAYTYSDVEKNLQKWWIEKLDM